MTLAGPSFQTRVHDPKFDFKGNMKQLRIHCVLMCVLALAAFAQADQSVESPFPIVKAGSIAVDFEVEENQTPRGFEGATTKPSMKMENGSLAVIECGKTVTTQRVLWKPGFLFWWKTRPMPNRPDVEGFKEIYSYNPEQREHAYTSQDSGQGKDSMFFGYIGSPTASQPEILYWFFFGWGMNAQVDLPTVMMHHQEPPTEVTDENGLRCYKWVINNGQHYEKWKTDPKLGGAVVGMERGRVAFEKPLQVMVCKDFRLVDGVQVPFEMHLLLNSRTKDEAGNWIFHQNADYTWRVKKCAVGQQIDDDEFNIHWRDQSVVTVGDGSPKRFRVTSEHVGAPIHLTENQ